MPPWALSVILVFLIGIFTSGPSAAEDPWSYDDLNSVLGSFVDADGNVDYAALATDRAALDRYVDALSHVSPDSHPDRFVTDAARLAYWVNAYNALVLQRVADAWPIDSVRTIRPDFGVFGVERHSLGGVRRTLRELEDDVIRKRFGDPRIHFAINCASAGCPALSERAWRPETLDADLDAAARRFVADPAKVRVDREAGVIHLSKIFEWFGDDFTDWLEARGVDHANGVTDYVLRYLPEPQGAALEASRLRVEWIEYDWSVNAAPAGSAAERQP